MGYRLASFNEISIHALREEGDRLMLFVLRAVTLFQSTPSARRATRSYVENSIKSVISIHALREEGDRLAVRCDFRPDHFNPRPPRGGRLPATWT